MKIKVGCDIVEIKKFYDVDKKTLSKIFHKTELKNSKAETLAGLFAAKESCKKVFNKLSWHDVEIKKVKNGKPKLILNLTPDANKSIISYDVSISHNGEYAIAIVSFLVEKK